VFLRLAKFYKINDVISTTENNRNRGCVAILIAYTQKIKMNERLGSKFILDFIIYIFTSDACKSIQSMVYAKSSSLKS
jgi:hypothetical protein